tara:strand:- start:753 stop:1133 length:381 start_codon:yes stop_codon:yes gene_type:complete
MNKILDSLDHITIITKDLKKTTNFYTNILDMKIDKNRPPFNFDGVWLSLNNRPVVHIVVNNNHNISNDKPTLDHIAFKAYDIELIKNKLNKHKIKYLEKMTPDNKIIQLFITDPNGIKLELSRPIK